MGRTYQVGRPNKMNWNDKKFQWRTTVDKKPYSITCGKLGLPRDQWTKVGSYQAAKAYFEAKQKQDQPIEEKVLARVGGKEALDERISSGRTAKSLKVSLEDRGDHWELMGLGGLHDQYIAELAEKVAPEVPKAETTSTAIDDFLGILAKQQSPRTYREIKMFLARFKDASSVKKIDEARIEAVYKELADKELKPATKKKWWGFYKRFVLYLAEKGIIQQPRNLTSRLLSFRDVAQKIKTWDNSVVRKSLKTLPRKFRCWALLGLNCGMTNADIGELRKDMIKDGYLTRKRVMTAKEENVPTVSYRLWPETIALLDEFKSDNREYWFASADGTPMVSTRIVDVTAKIKDLVALHWGKKVRDKGKCEIPLSKFRSIAATELESHELYGGRCVTHFLGHAPQTIKDRHYAAPGQELFDKAIEWLRSRFF